MMRKMGWLPDLPDIRDYTVENEQVKPMLAKAGLTTGKSLPEKVDLRKWCSPVEDQGELGSRTANACAALVEYYERRAFGKHIDASRLFIYKTTRNLMKVTGDTGAYIRTTMAAVVLFGVPPEEYWSYEVDDFDIDPPAFCYAFAQNYRAIRYLRLDPPGLSKSSLLKEVKEKLAAGLPSMFGFTVYSSIRHANESGEIPFPDPGERVLGGHAVTAVGYDDQKDITNPETKEKTKGALLIRNSWGNNWGEKGYGWLPYEYGLKGLAIDWWTLLKSEWIDTGKFGL